MNTVRHIVEMMANEPLMALSGLSKRIVAVEYGDERTQIGQASHFHMKSIKEDGVERTVLACRIEVDRDKLERIKEGLASGEITLFVSEIALGAISRPSS